MNWKNSLIKAFCALFSRRTFATKDPERILVISTTALGDTLWATPSLESLRKSFPKAHIAVLTSDVGFEVLRTNPWIDALYVLKEPLFFRLFSLWKVLYQEHFDTVLILHASQRLVFALSALLKSTRVIGTKTFQKGLESLCTDILPPVFEHAILRRLRMVEAIGGQIHTERLFFAIDQNAPNYILPEGSWVILHPGAKDPFRRWPAEHFIQAGKLLIEKTGCRILVTGVHRELDLMHSIANQIPGALSLDPHLSLHTFAKVLQQSKLVVTNDTGPIHLACALNVPVVGIYAASSPITYGTHKAENAITLSPPPPCTPCLKRKCQRSFCFLQIGPETVVSHCLSLYKTRAENTLILCNC